MGSLDILRENAGSAVKEDSKVIVGTGMPVEGIGIRGVGMSGGTKKQAGAGS